MTSVQSQLTRWLALVMMLLSILVGIGLTVWIRHAVLREFDRSILSNAHALQALVTRKPSGRLDVDVEMAALTSFTGKSATEYFCFLDPAGRTIAASDRRQLDLTARSAGSAWDTQLPNGLPVRALMVEYVPALAGDREDGEDEQPPAARIEASGQPIRLIVARDRRPLQAMLVRTTLAVGAAAVGLAIAAVVASAIIVKRGLRSLRVLALDVAGVDVNTPTSAFRADHRPAELHPVVETLNGLLVRVRDALQRERQFTAAASHELRTPIAELRLAADVALRRPDDHALLKRAALQARDIAAQMQALVATLLSMASVEQAAEPIPLESVNIHDALRQSIRRRADELDACGIRIDQAVPSDLEIQAQPMLLAAVFDNLLRNAAQYAPRGSTLHLVAGRADAFVHASFENATTQLTPADAGKVFQPFWRKDSARSHPEHIGMGLTLVKTYCAAMNIAIEAVITAAGAFRITLTCPATPSSASTAPRPDAERRVIT